jgi:hypothetical protein
MVSMKMFDFRKSPYYYRINKPNPDMGTAFTEMLKPGAPLKVQKKFNEYVRAFTYAHKHGIELL